MSQNKPRKSHYIPKFLLKNFTDDKGFLWCANLKTQCIFRTKPRKIFNERDLYISHNISPSISDIQYETDYVTREGQLSKLEGQTAPIVSRIINKARQGQNPKLSNEEHRIFIGFFFSMFRRNFNLIGRMQDDFAETYYQAVMKVSAKTGFPLPTEDGLYKNPRIVEIRNLMQQNTLSRFATGDHDILRDETEAHVDQAGLYIIHITNAKRSFIIGNRAFSIDKHNKHQPSWLPIADDTAVALSPNFGYEELLLVNHGNHGDQKINAINFCSAAKSDSFACRSESEAVSLMQRMRK